MTKRPARRARSGTSDGSPAPAPERVVSTWRGGRCRVESRGWPCRTIENRSPPGRCGPAWRGWRRSRLRSTCGSSGAPCSTPPCWRGLAGAVGAGFFAALEVGQRLLLDGLAGYVPLRAAGESAARRARRRAPSGPGCSRCSRPRAASRADSSPRGSPPSARAAAATRPSRPTTCTAAASAPASIPVKTIASVAAARHRRRGRARGADHAHRRGPRRARSGAGSRPPPRERRILVVAGVAAGISAVFRTPLGAALLAVEMLYRDDFESDALVPAIFASVVSYSVVASHLRRVHPLRRVCRAFPFVPRPPAALRRCWRCSCRSRGVAFVGALRGVARAFARLPGPSWLRPALGGLAMGTFATGVDPAGGRAVRPARTAASACSAAATARSRRPSPARPG